MAANGKLRRVAAVHAALAIAALGAVFLPALRPGAMLLGHDAYQLFLPLKQFLRAEFAQGHWPTWFPGDGLGIPVAGTFVAGLLDPLNVLLVLPPAQAVKWMVLLAYPIAALGAALGARALGLPRRAALFSGLAFALTGALVSQSVSLQYVGAFSRLPWALWAALRLRRAGRLEFSAALALALASTLWSGDPEVLFLGALTASVIVVWPGARASTRARWIGLIAAGIATALLTLPLLLPALHTFSGSARAGSLDPDEALAWSLHPARLAELVLGTPFLTASSDTLARFGAQNGGFWSQGCGVGVIVLALAVLGVRRPGPRWRWIAAGAAALALLLATGRYGHVYAHVPAMMHFRYPEKLVVWAALPIAWLAGRGLVGATRAKLSAWVIPLGIIVIAGVAGRAMDPGFGSLLVRGILFVGVAIAVAKLAPRRMRWIAIAALAFVELGSADRALLDLGEVATYLPTQSPLPEATAGERICSDLGAQGYQLPAGVEDSESASRAAQLATLAYGLPSLYGLRSTYGLTPAWPADLVTLCSVAEQCGTPCARLQGARLQWLQPASAKALLASGQYRRVRALESPVVAELLEDLHAPTYAAVLPARTYDDAFATIAQLHQGKLPTSEVAWVARADSADANSWTGHGHAQLASIEPGRIRISADADGSALLVLREAINRDWRATIDGTPSPIVRADFAMIGVPLAAGHHEVALDFVPFGGRWSLLGYALGLLLCAAAIVRGRR
ncbi:MAG: YfhO family protein [Deltaproteobacteria bacterium]|nr:YfhO family protein [Deltaproteobacteria bacterium]